MTMGTFGQISNIFLTGVQRLVADPGALVMQKSSLAIFGTRAPAGATPSSVLYCNT